MPSDKKRKRALEDDGISTQPGFFKLSSSIPVSKQQAGPVFASFPAIEPPPSTSYKAYSVAPSEGLDDEEPLPLIAGETDVVEFSTNANETKLANNNGCKYVLVAHNKRTKETICYPAAIPLHVMARQVKAHKVVKLTDPTAFEYKEARTMLGQTFGTKKAQAAIRAEERNRVDVSAMEGVAPVLQRGIEARTGALPTTDEAKEAADATRPIPPYDAETTVVHQIYKLHDIIPETEWKALSTTANLIIEATENGEKAYMENFPERRSDWLFNRIRLVLNGDSHKRKYIRILYYISAMLAFRRITERKDAMTKDVIADKLPNVPTVVIDSLIERFMELPRGSEKYKSTSHTQTLLLTHMFALCLHCENWAVDTEKLATSLSMPQAKVNALFKTLGCAVVELKERERIKLGFSEEDAKIKRAVLRAPVKFPKPKGKRATR